MNADEVTAAAAKPPAASAKPASLLRTVWDFLMNRPDDDDPKQKAAKVTGLVTLLATFLGLAIVTWTAQSSGVKGAWGIAFLWGLASFATGAVLGFLFGIPKVLQDDTKKTGEFRQGVNTNLEQISDWFTKIIVGLSLVNAAKLSTSFQGTAMILAAGLGDEASRKALAMALIVYFAVSGFLAMYLLTRLYLSRAFYEAESDLAGPKAEAQTAVKKVVDALSKGDTVEAAKFAGDATAAISKLPERGLR